MAHLTQEQTNKLRRSLDQVVDSWTRVKSEQEFVNECLKELSEEYGIDKKVLRDVAKVMFNTNMDEVEQKYNEIEDLYEKVTKAGTGNNQDSEDNEDSDDEQMEEQATG